MLLADHFIAISLPFKRHFDILRSSLFSRAMRDTDSDLYNCNSDFRFRSWIPFFLLHSRTWMKFSRVACTRTWEIIEKRIVANRGGDNCNFYYKTIRVFPVLKKKLLSQNIRGKRNKNSVDYENNLDECWIISYFLFILYLNCKIQKNYSSVSGKNYFSYIPKISWPSENEK